MGFGWYAAQTITGSVQVNTAQMPSNSSNPNLVLPNQAYDYNIWLIGSNGHVIGGSSSKTVSDLLRQF